MFKFLHAADLHLDSPLHGLEKYEGAPVEAIRRATRDALENLVRLAIDEEVAFVVIAGDVYDGDWRDYNTGLFFAKQMSRLIAQGVRVYMISGNHDAASEISRHLSLPEGVHVFATDRPETVIDEGTNAAIHGQGFATRAVVDDISAAYPPPRRGSFNVGVLHTCVTGMEGHDPYAPCTVEGLCDSGYDYWALGHIHTRQFLSERSPVIAFSGNIQGRHIRETGEKGCLLVEVDRGEPSVTFRPLDVFRWERCEIDASECESVDEISVRTSERIQTLLAGAEDRALAVRVTIGGQCPVHEQLVAEREHWEQELRLQTTHETRERVWIEKVRIATRQVDSDTAIMDEGPLAELRSLVAELDRLSEGTELHAMLAAELSDLERKLRHEVREELLAEHEGATDLSDSRWLRPIAREAGQLVLARLAGS